MSEEIRFHDEGLSLWDFTSMILVVCPKRAKCANVIPAHLETQLPPWRLARRLICPLCAYLREYCPSGVVARFGEDVDPFFGQPLWLTVPCAGQTLWAFNVQHLTFLEDYVRATHREKLRHDSVLKARTWRNTTLAYRLPEWMIVAKHRDEVLKGIETLKKRL